MVSRIDSSGVLSFGDPGVSVVVSSWLVVQILFEVDTLSEVWRVIELYVMSLVHGCL